VVTGGVDDYCRFRFWAGREISPVSLYNPPFANQS
jgi:hypothetical protein